MPSGALACHKTPARVGVLLARLPCELLVTFKRGPKPDGPGSTTGPLDHVLAPLAALLIAKWAGFDESEREAIAAFDEEMFTPELPEALRLPAWRGATRNHAGEVAEALGAMAARNGAGSAAAQHVARVAPLVTHVVEKSRSTYEQLYESIRPIDFGTSEGRKLAARLFDDVLRTVMVKHEKLTGAFATPQQVAALMLELAAPQPGDRVYDPCFGFGELLVGAARRLRETTRTGSPRVWSDIQRAGIFGVEIDRISYAVGLCRILLAGIDRPALELGDVLERPLPRNRARDGFDCILAVPPWGGGISRAVANQFPFPVRYSESLFLQHVMANLRPGGRAVVALPEGPLFRPGPDRQTRKALLSDSCVDAVVSLPAGAAAPWTGVAVNLVVFRRTAPRSAVRFVGIPANTWEAVTEARGDDIPDGGDGDSPGPGVGENGARDRSGFGDGAGARAWLADSSGFRGGSGWGTGSGDDDDFEGGIGSGAGFSDDSDSRGGFGSDDDFEGGSGHGYGTGFGVASEGGTSFGEGIESSAGFDGESDRSDGPAFPIELFRCVSDLSRGRHEGPANAILPGIETWEIPVRELALRDYELVARKSGNDALDGELARLAAMDPSLKIERLERVADIFAGRSYPGRCTTRSRDTDAAVAGLIGAADVPDTADARDAAGEATRGAWIVAGLTPSSFLTGEGATRLNERAMLRPLDIVVTTSGTVGKVAFLSAPAAGFDPGNPSVTTLGARSCGPKVMGLACMPMVATRGTVVLRARGPITPEYLAALLCSPAYRSALAGHARGTSIQRLPIRALRRLRIPVPAVPVQEAVLDDLSGLRSDAMAVLARLLSGASTDPVTVWLETPLVAHLTSERTDTGTDSHKPGALVAAARALDSLVGRVEGHSDRMSPASGERRIGPWLGVVRQVAMTLHGVESIPHGAGRLAILEVASSRLHEALRVLEGAGGSVVDRLRAFTRAMVGLSEREARAMQESIGLDISLEPAEVAVGVTSEVDLRLTNASAVPLRSLHFSTRPSVGAGRLPYLADGETHRFPLTVNPRDATRPLRIVVFWGARRIDGTPVAREAEVFLRVLSTREAVRAGDIGVSPYIVGNPVDREEMFFGRAAVMDRIKRQIGTHSPANVILLEGNRRTGKTSILRQIGRAELLPGWIPVYCSFQDAEGDDTRSGVTTHNVFRLLARTMGWALHDAGVETWLPGLPGRAPGRSFKLAFRTALNQAFAGEHPFEVFELYVEAAIEAASPGRVLLMLDEFDKLQEGIDAGITSPQVPENIRHLLQHQRGLSAIITGSRRLKRLREEYWSALFGLGYRVGVGALAFDDARRLVTEPVEGRLAYLPQARDRVVELCAGHPFLVQSLCNRVFEQVASGGAPTITVDTVERAATEMVRDNEHFRTLWDYAGSARRRLLLALCDRFAEGPDAVNLDLLEMKLRENAVSVRRLSELGDDIAELRELELLNFDDAYRAGTYRLSVPLMANWLRMHMDFADLVVRARQEAPEAGR